ncbi:MAG: mechanosensitive ion channel family protein [Myxococcales bacterium]|jgi:small-conductance mechanosensitive channel
MLDKAATWLQTSFGIAHETQGKIAASLAAVFIVWLARKLVLAVVMRRVSDPRHRYRWNKLTTWITAPTLLVLVGRIWFEGIQSLATFLGLVSAGIAIALKDLVANIAGWGFILWRRPFGVGDRIEIGSFSGDVIDVRIFQFTLLEIGQWVDADQSTGRIVHVPNGMVLSHPVANYTKGMWCIWDELGVTVTFESNWERAKGLLEQIVVRQTGSLADLARQQLQTASTRFLIPDESLTPAVYTSVVANGVRLTMRYLCEPRKRRATAHLLWEEALRAFAQHTDIEIAYPTQRFFDRAAEPQAFELAARTAKAG